jgi:hypothetical protein
MPGCCEHSNEVPGCIQGRKFLHQLSYFALLKRDSFSFSWFIIFNFYVNTIFMNQIHVVMKRINLSLCLTKHHDMNTYWGSGGIAPRIFNLGTR